LNTVNDHPLLEKKIGGKGRTLSTLEWDVKSYFILGGAMHDAAVSAWSIKGWHDYIRPISAIRYMSERGQSSDPLLANYDKGGIPLVEGMVEIVQIDDQLAGLNGEHVGKIKLYTWRGHQFIFDTETGQAGVGWILAEEWMPYQRPSFVTPPFAGYVSGHSTFSRAAAEVMTLLTGDEYFPGGIAEFIAYKNEFLVFEQGPSQDVTLQWATYRDASDQCSLSRIWGGIHPPADDIPGRLIGEKIGKEAFAFAIPYFYSQTKNEELAPIVYPNPASNEDIIIISNTLEDEGIQMIDIQGNNIPYSALSYNSNLKCTTLKLNGIPAGIYFIVTKNNTLKLIVI